MKEWKVPAWWTKYENFIKAFVMMLLPLFCCIIGCALDGKGIWDVYAPASEWNDELFYYKQVESILQYGFPQGYFGFNESHALKLSFAAWSPVLVFPWIIWGLLFGWNLSAPVYCNIFIMMVAMFVFVYMVKPAWKQLGVLAVLFVSFTPVTRFMLSAMPEVICFAAVIIMLAFVISYTEEAKTWKIVAMFIMASLMTMMRPYLILFLFFPIFFGVKADKVKGGIVSVVVLAVTGGAYAWINHYLSAEYFTPLFDTIWVETFFTEGIWAGIKFVLYKLFDVGVWATRTMIEGFISGYHSGKQIGAFVLIMVLIWIRAFGDFKNKNWKKLQIHLPLSVCYLAMLAAILLMYRPREGGRHLLTFIMGGIFVLSMMETKRYLKAIVAAGVFTYLFVVMATDTYEHRIPYVTEELEETVTDWETLLSEEMELSDSNVPSFDNVLIWTVSEEIDGEVVNMNWQMLYAVPAGFGISCCSQEYVEENLTNLQSRYLSVIEGGSLEEMCAENSFREIGRGGGIVIYELR